MYNENLEYIVSHFKDGVETSFGTVFVNGKNVSKSVLIPLINALSDEEAERLKEMCGNDFRLRELIDKRGVSLQDDKVFERNESVATLIEWLNVRKGWASKVKSELKRRFDYMSWEEQVSVMKVMFKTKVDRKWCYKKMRYWWNDAFTEDLMACWEKYHEENAAEVVARYAPMEFVMKYEDELARLAPANLCLRTGKMSYIEGKLNSEQECYSYIFVLSRLKPQLEYEAMKKVLYRVVAFDLLFYCRGVLNFVNSEFYGDLTSFLISAFGKMGCVDIIVEYEKWRSECLGKAEDLISLKKWPDGDKFVVYKNAIKLKTFIINLPFVSDNIHILYDVLIEKVKIKEVYDRYESLTKDEKNQFNVLRDLWYAAPLAMENGVEVGDRGKLEDLGICSDDFDVVTQFTNLVEQDIIKENGNPF